MAAPLPPPNPSDAPLVSAAFMQAVVAHLADPNRPPPDDLGFALWAARLVFLAEDEIARAVTDDRRRRQRPSPN